MRNPREVPAGGSWRRGHSAADEGYGMAVAATTTDVVIVSVANDDFGGLGGRLTVRQVAVLDEVCWSREAARKEVEEPEDAGGGEGPHYRR